MVTQGSLKALLGVRSPWEPHLIMKERLINYKNNYYIVNDDEPSNGDIVINIKGKEYKVTWCYEKIEKHSYFFIAISFMTGSTTDYTYNWF